MTDREWVELMHVINTAVAVYENGKYNNIQITLNEETTHDSQV